MKTISSESAALRRARQCTAPPDFLGRTSLPLLAALPYRARVLFLIDPFEALTNSGSIVDARFVSASIGGSRRLPFDDNSFHCVILDAQSMGMKHRAYAGSARGAILDEVARVLTKDGQLIVAVEHRRIPRNKRALGRYHLFAPDRDWTRRLRHAPLEIKDIAYVRAEGPRLTEIFRTSGPPTRDMVAASDYKVIRCGRPGTSTGIAVTDAVLEQVQASLHALGEGRACSAPSLGVRKIGKTVMRIQAENGASYIVRIPRSPFALERARQNFGALQTFSTNPAIPVALRELVPKAIFSGACADYPFYVEECRFGSDISGVASPPAVAWDSALQFITTLHVSTTRLLRVDSERFRESFGLPLQQLRAVCSDGWASTVIDRLEHFIHATVDDLTMPFVWSHGDFFVGNCLYGPSAQLTGVVDWEFFSDTGLPLLEVLHCMRIPGERNDHPTWQRFSTVYELIRRPHLLLESPILSSYVRRLEIPAEALPALLVMYWVDHVSTRIRHRASEPLWMTKRVYDPLKMWDALQLDCPRRALRVG